ncbi:Endoribonuclease L-PSP/chorismate mutase-like protein [Lophiotrema nucula]|uniref:Endoribonuclease L-PSP/chorismate mutase-like protein n=1 Tax=Lophiotrema nucula TaxID=690887 RepID=A0A6A5ZAL7_9PLEO|nr:Endoribonuclease L-PSP/chorismate mutase-like protein [Lophiotrema nucula]
MSHKLPHAFNPPDVPTPPPTYSQACIARIVSPANLITLAGQTGSQSDGTISDNFIEQVKGAYQRVLNGLKACGATPRDITFVRHYIVQTTGNPDLDGKDVYDRGWADLWSEFMDKEADGHRPPDTVLGVASLAKRSLWYEVEVTAIVNGASS